MNPETLHVDLRLQRQFCSNHLGVACPFWQNLHDRSGSGGHDPGGTGRLAVQAAINEDPT